jgi:hypothetical protein
VPGSPGACLKKSFVLLGLPVNILFWDVRYLAL